MSAREVIDATTGLPYIHESDIVPSGGLGAHTQWDMNTKHAKRIGAERQCQHCARPLNAGAGWEAAWAADGTFCPLANAGHNGYQIIALGNECARQFMRGLSAAMKDRYFREVTA